MSTNGLLSQVGHSNGLHTQRRKRLHTHAYVHTHIQEDTAREHTRGCGEGEEDIARVGALRVVVCAVDVMLPATIHFRVISIRSGGGALGPGGGQGSEEEENL